MEICFISTKAISFLVFSCLKEFPTERDLKNIVVKKEAKEKDEARMSSSREWIDEISFHLLIIVVEVEENFLSKFSLYHFVQIILFSWLGKKSTTKKPSTIDEKQKKTNSEFPS